MYYIYDDNDDDDDDDNDVDDINDGLLQKVMARSRGMNLDLTSVLIRDSYDKGKP